MLAVFPVNGTGGRFVQQGYKIPKPFLKAQGVPLITRAVQSISHVATKYLFAVRQEWYQKLIPYIPESSVVIQVDTDTPGPIQTLLTPTCQEVILELGKGGLWVTDCDSFFTDPSELEVARRLFVDGKARGGCTLRLCTDWNCSYAERGPDGSILRTFPSWREHLRWSTTGPYWWSTGEEFIWAARHGSIDGETTISPLYNYLIQLQGEKVLGHPVTTFTHLGTPEALEEYNAPQQHR